MFFVTLSKLSCNSQVKSNAVIKGCHRSHNCATLADMLEIIQYTVTSLYLPSEADILMHPHKYEEIIKSFTAYKVALK